MAINNGTIRNKQFDSKQKKKHNPRFGNKKNKV